MRRASGASVPALADAVPKAGASGRWADLRQRAVSAALLAPATLFCIWWGGAAWAALVMAAAAGLGWEWATMCGAAPARVVQGALVPGGLVAAALVALLAGSVPALAMLALAAALMRVAGGSWALLAGLPYVGVPLVALVWLRGAEAGGWPALLVLMLVVWASDIGAYAAGRVFGGRKLAPRISPGKTWSGAVGGLVAAVVVGLLAARVAGPVAAVAGGLIGVMAQAGDLLESWVKRRFGVKDSGWLIPGHGGLLDRLDGLLAAAPVAAGIAAVLGREGVPWG